MSYTAGWVGQGFVFDGNADAVSVGTATNLRLQDFTIEAWIQRASASSVTHFWDGGAQWFGGGADGYNFGIDADGRPFMGKVGISLVKPSATVSNTNWHHVAVTKSGSTVFFYVDGVAYPAATYNQVFTFTWGFAIGARADTQGNSFLGKIDELAVYSRALDATEVQAVYSAGGSGKCTTPTPPSIFTQPTNQTVVAGDTALFAVVAGGAMPLSYQWSVNGTNIGGATLATLTLPNVQPNQAGDYSVLVTNAFGAVTSYNAMLAVEPLLCTNSPPGLISWWRGETSTLDYAGGNHGTLVSEATYGTGRVGQGFAFDGSADSVRLGYATNLWLQSFSIEAWIRRSSASAVTYFFDGGAQFFSCGLGGYNFGIDASGKMFLGKVGISLVQPNAAITDTNFHHVAVTKSGSAVTFYVDGAAYPAPAYNAVFDFPTTVAIGARPHDQGNSFLGTVDELAVYSRALSATEVQAIYSAGSSGKCVVPFAPFFLAQPSNQFALAGSPVTLAAVAGGTPPLIYQWTLNGTNLPGATTNTLSLPSVSSANAGTYNLIVTNGSPVGAITSAPAFLDVRYALAYAASTPLFGSNYTFIGSAELTLHSVFPSANTFYTLDGSAPSYGSRYYSGPVTVTRSSGLRFVTYSADFLQSWEAPALGVIIIPTYPVTATTRGGGTVTVVPPVGPYVSNATVTVTATPAAGWTFLQWQGDASGTNPSVQLTVNHPQRLEALFGTTLGTSVAGSGALQVHPSLSLYPYGTVARLTAIPQAGSSFAVWGNAASGNVNPLSFPITNTTPTVSCLFAPLVAGQHALAVVTDGFGRVTVNPRANTYAAQTGVTLTAISDPGQDFVGWSGDATGTQNPLTLTMDVSKTITAQFSRRPSLAVDAAAEWLDTAGCRLTLVGEVGAVCEIESSTNLTDWAANAVLTNIYGRVQFNDLTATNFPNQFYRARQSP